MSQYLNEKAKIIRKDILKMIFNAKASHIGSCFSIIEVLNILYGEILKNSPYLITDPARDFLIFSKGHAAAALYATLANYGFFSKDELSEYCLDGARLAGHVTALAPGVEFSSGSLGHGLSLGCGVALTKKNDVYVIQSDGECDEGSVWEAALFASHHQLNNLTLIIDYNKIQSFGYTKEVLNIEPLRKKWEAFNWHAIDINGHDYSELRDAFCTKTSKPKVIIANTVKGKGVSFMENELIWHYKSPNEQEFQLAIDELSL